MSRNMYKHPEYSEMIKRMFSGQEFTFANVSGFDTKTISQTVDESNISGKAMRARKKKSFD